MIEVTDEMLTAAMRAFEPMSSVLRYREKDKWHTCDLIGMREAIKAALNCSDGGGESRPARESALGDDSLRGGPDRSNDREGVGVAPGPSDDITELVRVCARTTLIGFRDDLTEREIAFICDQIARKSQLEYEYLEPRILAVVGG